MHRELLKCEYGNPNFGGSVKLQIFKFFSTVTVSQDFRAVIHRYLTQSGFLINEKDYHNFSLTGICQFCPLLFVVPLWKNYLKILNRKTTRDELKMLWIGAVLRAQLLHKAVPDRPNLTQRCPGKCWVLNLRKIAGSREYGCHLGLNSSILQVVFKAWSMVISWHCALKTTSLLTFFFFYKILNFTEYKIQNTVIVHIWNFLLDEQLLTCAITNTRITHFLQNLFIFL